MASSRFARTSAAASRSNSNRSTRLSPQGGGEDARALPDRVVPRLASRPPAIDRARARLRQPPGAGRARGAHRPARSRRHEHDPRAPTRERLHDRRRGEHPRLPQRTLLGVARVGSAAAEGGQSAPPLPGGGMPMLATGYTLSEKTTLPFEQAVQRVREELKTEDFNSSRTRWTACSNG